MGHPRADQRPARRSRGRWWVAAAAGAGLGVGALVLAEVPAAPPMGAGDAVAAPAAMAGGAMGVGQAEADFTDAQHTSTDGPLPASAPPPVLAQPAAGDVLQRGGTHTGTHALDQGGVPAPAPSAGAVPRETVGPGVYDVVVVPLSVPGSPSPAMAGGAERIIPAADAVWRDATDGRFRLDLRAVAFADMPAGDPCDLDQVAEMIEPAVARVTDGGVPRTGRVGVLAVAVVAPGLCEVAGLGYIGANVALVVGHWDETDGPMVVAHEVGHTFGLGHADAVVCPGTRPQQWLPAWPCSPLPYGDHTSVMGNDPQPWDRGRLGVAHLRRLGLLRPELVVEVPRAATDVVLHPVYGSGTGTRAASLVVADGSRWLVEYRPGRADPGVADPGVADPGNPPPGDGGVMVRRLGDGRHGPDTALLTTPGRDAALRAGDSVVLPDGTSVAVLAAAAQASVRVIPPAGG